jgi:NifB/MoaA-like Fe-S oxidoreductase
MLRNRRGATSLRWLRALLDHGIEVHGQVVVCPGVNDGPVLDDTLTGILDRFPELATVACVPLGVSRFNVEAAMRPHTEAEARYVVDLVERYQQIFLEVLGRRLVYAADEYYLLAGRSFPHLKTYGGIAQHDNGVGMVRAFEARFQGRHDAPTGGPGGFFQSVDGAPAAGYRAPRGPVPVGLRAGGHAPVTVLTGTYGAAVIRPLLPAEVEVLAVPSQFFGGNIGVAGLLTGGDLRAALDGAPPERRYLLPDVCLSGGRFLDGLTPADLPRPVEVVPADGAALRAALAR